MSNKKQANARRNALRVIPLGGLGEIGKNMTVFEYGDEILIVDTGIMFPESDMLGIDYIIPDFKYLMDKKHKVKGIVITHGHEDHTGAIHHVAEQINAPIYATPLTKGLLEVKLARGGQSGKAKVHEVNAGDTVQIGVFKVEFCHVCHSIPDCVALGITTPAGLIVHTGDYKLDHTPVDNWPTDYAKLAEFAGRGVLAMLGDSTNADRAGWTPSERVIEPAFDKVFRQAQGRILVATFASLISRIQQVGEAALRHGRKMAFVGTSMRENAKMAKQLGYLELPDELLVPIDEALKLPPHEVVLMCTGSQGEPSSIVGRLASGTNRQFDLLPTDTVVLSSHPIPGNEESVSRTINKLFQRGAHVVYDPLEAVHVSGHASQEEMKFMLNLIKPKYLVPVHGELRHLHQHAALAESLGYSEENVAIVENGQVIEFQGGKMFMGERVPGGYVFVDGSSVGDIGPAVMRERDALSRQGFVLVNLNVNRHNGKLLRDPEIITRGFMYQPGEDFLDSTRRQIEKTLAEANGDVQRQLESTLRDHFFDLTKRKPMLFVTINRN
ncbi:MAG: ribonuclease J [Anaerolineales bacterium]|jgi:ribonuclease J|nr:ribonuclease J [Anaerolineales bacterium]MCW5887286.1 ribonuclease J [Anaerolineales bacterium]